jgi:hypothetical protein
MCFGGHDVTVVMEKTIQLTRETGGVLVPNPSRWHSRD